MICEDVRMRREVRVRDRMKEKDHPYHNTEERKKKEEERRESSI